MGGNVVCRPALGAGARLQFTARLEPAALATETPAASGERPRLQGRVLVVEDHPVNLMVATALLERMGLEWREAGDGAQALAEMAGGGFDLVLMDCQMPVLDGLEATRRWRGLEAAHGWARLPIVALTANALSGDASACREAGMDGYLSKPFEAEALHAELSRFLTAHGRPRSDADNLAA